MHLNKETLNLAELVGLEGHPGRFTARLRVSPRYLDATKCTACGDCAAVCPVSLPSEFIQGLEPRKAVFKSYPQAVPNAFSLSKGPVNPCVTECPAGVNAHAYVSLASEGRYREALEVILDTLPLPGTLTRICARPCEARCRRDLMEGPLAIRDIIRLVTDHADLCGGGRHPRGTHWPAAHGDSRRGPGRALLRLPPGQDRDRLHRLRGQGRFRRRPPDGHPRLPPPADGAGQGRNFPAMGTSSSSATWP
jgi:ferredoxin